MRRIDRHLGGAKWAKKASRRGLRNATENVTKKASQNCRFGGSKKHEKMIENEAQRGTHFIYLGHFGGPWEARG